MKKFFEFRLFNGTWELFEVHYSTSRRSLMKRLSNPESPHDPHRKVRAAVGL